MVYYLQWLMESSKTEINNQKLLDSLSKFLSINQIESLFNNSLQELDLKCISHYWVILDKNIGDSSATSLSEALLQNSSLQQLNLESISHYLILF